MEVTFRWKIIQPFGGKPLFESGLPPQHDQTAGRLPSKIW